MKNLYDISWKVDEQTYRDDPALSYSTLAKYERSGFNGLSTLFDKIDSPSLTFGSAVDALITGGEKEFNDKFIVASFPAISDTLESIVKDLFAEFHITHPTLSSIPDIEIIGKAANYNYQNNWKPETRAKVIKEKCADYYNLLFLAQDKTLLEDTVYSQVLSCVDALKTSDATKWFFAPNDLFDNTIERFYQPKFKATFNNVEYRCMMDLVVVDHKNKIIYPVDLKTSSHKEWDFPKSFLQWNYQIQARLYYRILKDNLERDDYFKDFKIEPYRFIVVNKETLTPLVWKLNLTYKDGDISFINSSNEKVVLRDPFIIGEELNNYLKKNYAVPVGIIINGDNDLDSGIKNL